MSHTILLVQPGPRPETRTYSDYESVNDCMEGVCKIYEEHLKRRNPNTPTITYDISQLFDFVDQQPEQMQSNKFETQCVLDTQLINIIENAEALIDIPKNMSQEFNTTFNNLDSDDKQNTEILENVVNERYDVDSKDLNTQGKINKITSITNDENNSQDDISIELNDNSEELRNANDIEVERLIELKTNKTDHKEETSKSPILNIISPNLKPTPSPLVYELESFEKFETIALSVIKENPNFEAAKRIINSQIMNNELFIQTHAEPVLGDRDKSPSPVLKINKPTKDVKNAKKTSVIEDSILFSSDEENDFKNDFVDLPLTCALETSFYKQHDVLDKTMFVGFQTASNKSIQINSDSYSKAKSILDNVKVPDEYMSLTKLVEVIDNSSKVKNETLESRNQNNDQFETKEESCHHNNTDLEIESLKELNIPEVLAKSKRVFEEMVEYDDDQDLLNDLEHDDFNTCNSKKVKLSENNLDIDKGNTELNEKLNVKTENYSLNTTNICYKDEYHNTNVDPPLNDNLNIDENIMKEFENNFINEEDYNTTTLKTDNDDAKSDSIKIDEVRKKVSESPFVGFKTANNNSIKISEQGLAKTRNIFEGIDLNDLEESSNLKRDQNSNSYLDQPSTSKDFMGFRTANNKEIKVSEQALAQTKKIFDNIDNEDILPINKNTVDKQSANMYQIDAALNNNNFKRPSNKSRGFINPFPSNRNNNNNNLLKTTNVSPKSPDSLNILNENNKLEVPKIIGFQTASNKTVKISKEALAKSKKIFSEVMSDDNEKETYEEHENFIADENVMKEFETASMKTKEADDNTHLEFTKENKHKGTNVHEKEVPSPLNLGFKTANNKCIKPSEQALAKTRNFFEDIDLNDLEGNINSNKNKNYDAYLDQPSTSKGFMGFRTANNKEIKVSEQALAKTKSIFDNIDNENCMAINKADKTSKNMNQNKVVNIQNKNNFKKPSTPSDLITNKQSFRGFKTASNKAVSISEDALTKSKNIFKDIDNFFDKGNKSNNNLVTEVISDYNKATNPIIGFKTASNKPVKVTYEALARTKNIFQDIDGFYDEENIQSNDDLVNDILNNSNKVTNPIIHGFRTASNKAVKISEDALAKSKKIFEDIEFSQQPNNDLVKDLHKPVFEGFKTANNKAVKISKDALARSKKVFQDLDKSIDDDQNRNVNKENVFCGFQTASNKSVGISKDALLKSKKIFEDLELSQSNFGGSKSNFDKGDKMAFGFKTANNNDVEVSEESLKVTKKLFDNVASNEVINKECSANVIAKPNNVDLELDELMNTEVIKNLEESLHTEDFSKQSPISKRSGSPILSCPKAKKRKVFKTPQTTNKIIVTGNIENKTPTNKYIFEENYKKNKKYTLKDIKEIDSINSDAKIDPYLLSFTFDTLLDFEFGGKRNDIDSDVWTTDRIREYFTDSVNKKIVPEGWITNHLKLIIWKLLSYEIYFSNCMGNVCTVKNVLNQLKYRYDRELYNVERPALRKILEKDEVASKFIVLCVAGLYVNGECVSSITNQTQNIELLLTDGWYSIKACADRMVDKLIWDGKICVGTKLAIYGAELMNCEQGIAPWEDTSTIRLKISGNSVRRAKWDTKLGFHGNGAILSHLTAVKPEGGKISRLCVFVARVYPMLYVEKFEDGSTVTRSERLEHIQQMKHEADRQNQIEKLYDELEKMAEQESQDSEGMDSDKGLETGSQIYRHMKRNKDTSEFRVNLTDSQTHLFQEHALKKREKLIQNLQTKVEDLVKKRGLDVPRNVVPLLKMRVADVYRGCVSKAMITIWRPNECLLDLITEGAWLDVYNVVPTAVRFSEIQISAGRQSIFQPSKLNKSNKLKTYTDTLKRKCYPIKDLQTLTTDNYEIDTIGLIFLIDPPNNQFQNIYLTDENKNIVSINFWGGIKKFGFENILDTGQIVACLNLQRRTGNTKKQIPQYRATEFTHFTRTCKIDFIRKMTEDLSTKFISIDKKKFINDCVAIKNNFHNLRYGNTENVTPYRLNNSDYNISKNKMFIDSPLVGKLDINLNLSGLDFESTFRQTDTQDESPERLLRKRKVNERIAKLQMYGEPPPLNPIHIINKSTIQPYKSPLIQKSDTNVASVKIVKNVKSPVLNRTYVKSINPVKLKFSDEDGNTTDPFAEEFDCSPPLSLD